MRSTFDENQPDKVMHFPVTQKLVMSVTPFGRHEVCRSVRGEKLRDRRMPWLSLVLQGTFLRARDVSGCGVLLLQHCCHGGSLVFCKCRVTDFMDDRCCRYPPKSH